MRQIVFRGRCFNSPTWVYGLPYIEGIDTNGEKWVSIRQPKENGGFTSYTVDPETIGQFTGLYDKNGKEIYEGDIIRSFDSTGLPIIHSIVWLESCAKFVAQLDSDSKYGRTCCDLDKDWIDEFCKEVIGNCWSNPELLKGGK